jgi:hypothetical protein
MQDIGGHGKSRARRAAITRTRQLVCAIDGSAAGNRIASPHVMSRGIHGA